MNRRSVIPHFEPCRELGRTGFKATILGVGDVADRQLALAECVATVRRAMDAGLNVIDTAPSYEEGYSEEIVGAALKGRRHGMFVIDKVDHFHEPVAPQVEGSLKRLALDSVDLLVFHGVSKAEDWSRMTAPGSSLDQLAAVVKAGKARFTGISSHNPDILTQAMESGWCDVVLFPIGPYVDRRYVEDVLPLARKLGVGTVCFKTFGAGKLVGDTSGYGRPLRVRPRGKVSSGGDGDQEPRLPRLAVEDCVGYTLTCDPDVALLGLSFPNEQDAAWAAARSFRPLSVAHMEDIRNRAAMAVQGKGDCWWNPAC